MRRGLGVLLAVTLAMIGTAMFGVGLSSATNGYGPGLGAQNPTAHYNGVYNLTPLTDTSNTPVTGQAVSVLYGACINGGLSDPGALVNTKWTIKAPVSSGTAYAATLSWLGYDVYHQGSTGWTDPVTGHFFSANTFYAGFADIAYAEFNAGARVTPWIPGTAYNYVTTFIHAYPGPWSLTVTSLGVSPFVAGTTYTGTLQLKAVNGNGVPGQAVLASPTTGASVTVTGVTNAAGLVPFKWDKPTPGTSVLNFSMANASPANQPVLLAAPNAGAQTMLAAWSFTNARTAQPVQAHAPSHPGNLTILKEDATGGSPLEGAVFHVSGPSHPTGITVASPATGTIHLTGLQYGSYRVEETASPPGFILPTTPFQTVTVGALGTAPVANPTVTFSDVPAAATINTAASAATAQPGVVLSDRFTVSGLPTNVGLNGGAPDATTVSWKLEGPVPAGAGGKCSAATYGSAPVYQKGVTHIVGNGSYVAGPATAISVAGCYGWSETLPASAYTAGASSGPTATNESTLVSPTISTKAHAASKGVGEALSDTAVVGGVGTNASLLSWKVLGPAVPAKTGACPAKGAWTKAPTLASGILAVSKDGTYPLTSPRVTVAGCYTWVETLASTTTPAAYATVSTTAGTATETLYLAPTVSTIAHETAAGGGGLLSDKATVSGVSATFKGTLTGTVYGPLTPVNGACSSLVWTTAPVFATVTVTVTKSGSITLAAPNASSVGCYSWAETLSSGGTSLATSSGKPGTVAETTLTIPAMSTSEQSSGHSYLDRVNFGFLLPGQKGSLMVQLLGPVAVTVAHATCAGVTWAKAPTSNSQTIAVVGAQSTSTASSAPVVLSLTGKDQAACYTFTDTLTIPGFAPVIQAPGTAKETFLLTTHTTASPPKTIVTGGANPARGNSPLILAGLLIDLAALGLLIMLLRWQRQNKSAVRS